ncbi:MAG TPA: DMT family transporter [Rudaea sp.]|nr:DMT family transporter [Rudaea sp.]
MTDTTARRQALIALGLMSLIWSFNWIVMKRALHYIGPLDFSALRTLFGTVLLFTLLWWRGESGAPTPLRDTILIGLAQTAAFQLLVQMSLVEGGAGKMALLAYTMPFWVIAFAWLLLGDKPTARHWIFLAIAAVGLLLVMEPWRAIGGLRSCVLALAGGACWGLATVLTKRLFLRGAVSPLRLTAWQSLYGAIVVVLVALLVPERPIEWSSELIGAVAYNAVLGSAIAWALWLFVVERLPAGVAGVASLATPLLGVLLAWGLLDEVPDRDEAIGIALIGVALAGVLRPASHKRGRKEP